MKISQIKKAVENGSFDKYFLDQYIDENVIGAEKARYKEILDEYMSANGDKDVKIVASPGRTEIGGNHTDHQHGRVLAGAINSDITAVCEKTDDGIISIKSDSLVLKPIDTADTEVKESEKGTSEALIRGVVHKLKSQGYKIGGFRAICRSEVLVGSGLSSSAAFENLAGGIISCLYNEDKIPAPVIAKASQYAEREFYGKPCGLMDQMASAVGGLVGIDFNDPENPVIEEIDFDLSKHGYSLCITDTKDSHEDLTHEYAAIVEEMAEICKYYGKEFLRDVKEEDFYRDIPVLREKAGDRAVLRAIHFFEENNRAAKEAEFVRNGNFEGFKKEFISSGNSSFKFLQNVYSGSKPSAQGLSLALALSEKVLCDNGFARVHGGGFAGTIQAFVKKEYVNKYKETMDHVFGQGSCHVYQIKNGNYRMDI